jgi:hypothetical protein
MPGPPRKRDEERRRRNKDGAETIKVNLDEVLAQEIEIPAPPYRHEVADEETGELEELAEPEPMWHPLAEQWYLSLAKSGQAIFYEPSDWTTAYLVAEQISIALEPRPTVIGETSDGEPVIRFLVQPMPGATLNAVLKACSSLMATEGDRRRLRIELDRKKAQDAALAGDGKVTSITKNREDVFRRDDRSELA